MDPPLPLAPEREREEVEEVVEEEVEAFI